MLDSLQTLPAKEALATYSSLVSKLTNDPSPEKPETNAPNQPTYDVMLLHLLEQVSKEAKELSKAGDEPDKVVEKLAERLSFHNDELDGRTAECNRLIAEEEAEAKKKITSDDIHDGFSSGVSPCVLHQSRLMPTLTVGACSCLDVQFTNKIGPNYLDEEKKPSAKGKETAIEVLNPGASVSPR